MSNIQFYHKTPNRCYQNESPITIAVEVPSKEQLRYATNTFDEIFVNVGRAKLHPNDQYIKSIGRQVASSRMKQEGLVCIEINEMGEHDTVMVFENLAGNTFTFKVSSKSDKVWFVNFQYEYWSY